MIEKIFRQPCEFSIAIVQAELSAHMDEAATLKLLVWIIMDTVKA
jgi:hypothetical protein